MAAADKSITFPLNGSVVETALPVDVQPPDFVELSNVTPGAPGLIGRPAKVPAQTALTYQLTGSYGHSMAYESGNGSTVFYGSRPGGSSQIVLKDTAAQRAVASTVDSNARQNAFWPVQIDDAYDALPVGATAFVHLVSEGGGSAAVNGGYTAALDILGQLWLSVRDTTTGEWIYPPTIVATSVDDVGVFLTEHNGRMVLWYGTATHIMARKIITTAGVITVGSAGTTVVGAYDAANEMADFGVTRVNATTVYVCYVYLTGGTNYAYQSKITVADDATTTYTEAVLAHPVPADFAINTPAFCYMAINACTIYNASSVETSYLGMAWSDLTGAATQYALYDITAAAWIISPTSGSANLGPVSVNFLATGASAATVYSYMVVTATDGTGTMTAPTSESIKFYRISTGALAQTIYTYGSLLHGKGVTVRRDSTTVFPVFAMARHVDDAGSYVLTADTCVLDPSIRLVAAGLAATTTTFHLTPIARFAVDNTIQSHTYRGQWLSNSGDELDVAYYCNANAGDIAGRTTRVVKFNLNPRVPSVSDNSGVAFVAGALPVSWDGAETAEWCPMNQPMLSGVVGAGAGSNLNGTYKYRCVVRWFDLGGQVHRSSPSNVVTLTPAVQKVRLKMVIPQTFKDATYQTLYEVELYGTDASGIYYVLNDYVSGAVSGGVYVMEPTTFEETNKPLYCDDSAGSVLHPVCPSPAWDVALCGKRMWIIDAEWRRRLMYSKEKELEVAHEFAGELEMWLPPQSGNLMALENQGGRVVIFAETGIYTVMGDGPDNTGNGAGYEHAQISTYGCALRDSVVLTPAGILFVTDAYKFALLQGSSVRVFDQLTAVADVVGTYTVLARNEVIFFCTRASAAVTYIYNWVLDKWSTSTGYVAIDSMVGKYASVNSSTLTTFYKIDPTTYHATAQATWKTGWVMPESPTGDLAIREVWINGYRSGAHGMTVTVYRDYGTANDVFTFAAADITASAVNGYYTVRCSLSTFAMRSVQIKIVETGATGQACVPLYCTLVYQVSPGVYRQAVLPALAQ